jgi:hypothetical protein
MLTWRIYRYRRRIGDAPRDSGIYAVATVVGKIPQFEGLLVYYLNRVRGRRAAIIEYKGLAHLGPDAGISGDCA